MGVAAAGLITGPVITTSGLHNTVAVTAALFVVGALASAAGIRNPGAAAGG